MSDLFSSKEKAKTEKRSAEIKNEATLLTETAEEKKIRIINENLAKEELKKQREKEIALADLNAKKLAEEEAEVLKNDELEELSALKEKDVLKEEFRKFKIISATYSNDKSDWSTQAILSLSIKNETKYPILKAYFKASLKSKSRTIPWKTDTFMMGFDGGIESNETVSRNLILDREPWKEDPLPADIIMNVELLKLYGADGKELLISSVKFTEEDNKRLIELKNKYQ